MLRATGRERPSPSCPPEGIQSIHCRPLPTFLEPHSIAIIFGPLHFYATKSDPGALSQSHGPQLFLAHVGYKSDRTTPQSAEI